MAISIDENQKVIANVILKSSSGGSIIKSAHEMLPDNIEEFLPLRKTVQKASKELKKLGFTIDLDGETYISISAPRKLFEVFEVKLEQTSNHHFHSVVNLGSK